MKSVKQRIFEIISIGNQEDWPSRAFDYCLVAAIFLNITVLFLETFDTLADFMPLFLTIEYATLVFFMVEYALRIYTATELYDELPPLKARLRFLVSFDGIVDLLTILPFFFLEGFAVFRILRVVRIFHLFRLNAYYDSFNVIASVIYRKRNQLISSIFILLILLFASSLCMYSAEHEAQPELFENAFSGIWYSLNTIFTVGYGDIYPITRVGRLMGAVITFLGVGAVAIPTGIISAGFVEEYQRMTEREQHNDTLKGTVLRHVKRSQKRVEHALASASADGAAKEGPEAVLAGAAGNAAMPGAAGNAAMFGAAGNAAMLGAAGNAAMPGAAGNAAMFGAAGNAAMFGAAGNAAIFGAAGNAAMSGAARDAAMSDPLGGAEAVSANPAAAGVLRPGTVPYSTRVGAVLAEAAKHVPSLEEYNFDEKAIRVVRATTLAEQTGAYYVRIQAMARQYHITASQEFDRFDTPDTRYIVLKDKEFPVATCRLVPVDQRVWMVGRVVVLEDYRGLGLGRRTVQEAENWIRELGGNKCILDARDSAVGFYEKMGYRVDKSRITYGEVFTCIRVEKDL